MWVSTNHQNMMKTKLVLWLAKASSHWVWNKNEIKKSCEGGTEVEYLKYRLSFLILFIGVLMSFNMRWTKFYLQNVF